jgi:hypothetical protein
VSCSLACSDFFLRGKPSRCSQRQTVGALTRSRRPSSGERCSRMRCDQGCYALRIDSRYRTVPIPSRLHLTGLAPTPKHLLQPTPANAPPVGQLLLTAVPTLPGVNQLASQVVRVLPHTASALSSLHPFEIGDRTAMSMADRLSQPTRLDLHKRP